MWSTVIEGGRGVKLRQQYNSPKQLTYCFPWPLCFLNFYQTKTSIATGEDILKYEHKLDVSLQKLKKKKMFT